MEGGSPVGNDVWGGGGGGSSNDVEGGEGEGSPVGNDVGGEGGRQMM